MLFVQQMCAQRLIKQLIGWTWNLIFHLVVQNAPNAVSCGVSFTHDMNTNTMSEWLSLESRILIEESTSKHFSSFTVAI